LFCCSGAAAVAESLAPAQPARIYYMIYIYYYYYYLNSNMSSSHTLCEKCALFCRTFSARFRSICKGAAREVEAFFAELAHTCVCLVHQAPLESRSRRSASRLACLPLLNTGNRVLLEGAPCYCFLFIRHFIICSCSFLNHYFFPIMYCQLFLIVLA